MIEKVNPMHPDKIADRIAGALVDYAYAQQERPKCAFEVLIGHGICTVIGETSVDIPTDFVVSTVDRIASVTGIVTSYLQVPQDPELAKNQSEEIKCGDNGIFKGSPLTSEQIDLSDIANHIYDMYGTDGKYILNAATKKLIVCQSHAAGRPLRNHLESLYGFTTIVNPLGDWTGGIDVDSGATNRKLGSDMADGVTGGGLHGKDLSKADVSVNIYAHLKAQKTHKPVEIFCAIGDDTIDGKPYSEVVAIAGDYIKKRGGFEKFAEWGLF